MSDNEQFTQIAEKYMDMLYRIAFSWLKNRDDANDVTQEVLLKLYRYNENFASEDHLKNWLVRVCINQCKMVFRSPWHSHEDLDDYADTLFADSPDHRALFDAVMRLDKKYRVPLMLMYYEGYSTAEIAEFLHLNEKTVSTHIFRAKKKLKEYLED